MPVTTLIVVGGADSALTGQFGALEKAGFRVLSAASLEEARRLKREAGDCTVLIDPAPHEVAALLNPASATGLAHEFNNLLAIVLNNIEAARRQLDRQDPDLVRVRRATDNAADGAARAVALARHMLNVDQREGSSPSPLPLFTESLPMEADAPALPAAPRILIVEDEVLVRMMAVDALEIHGFAVEEAGSAEDALQRFAAAASEGIDAVIVDVGLPDRKGDVLAADLRARYPALPIVIASGYDEASFRHQFRGDPAVGFLAKPYDSSQLKNALRALGIVAS